MSWALKILPVCGEGDHAVVEGRCRLSVAVRDLPNRPSTTLRAVPLPMNGEDLA
jgi:hypothetical protein